MWEYVAAQQNQLGYDQGKAPLYQRLLSRVFHNRLRRAGNTLPQQSRCYKRKGRRVLNGRTISNLRRVVSNSATLSTLLYPFFRSPRALRSESDIFATSARGSCGVDPGPVPLRIITFSASSMGDWLYGVRKRVVLVRSLMFSTFAMLRFTALAVRGGGTDLALMCPKKGSPGATNVFEKIAPSSA